MTLQNLLRIGRLKAHAATSAEVQRLLQAIDRNLADAAVAAISDETRFDAAYKAVMQCALVAMMAAGYRPATSEAGHHQTLIQSLPLTLSVANDVWWCWTPCASNATPTTTPASPSRRRWWPSAWPRPRRCASNCCSALPQNTLNS